MANLPDPKAEQAWRAAVDRVLKGAPFDTLVSHSQDGIDLQPLYAAASASATQPVRADQHPCRIVQRIDHPALDAANAMAHAEASQGVDTLVLSFRGAPTSRGFGLTAAFPADFATLLAGVDLGATGLRLESPPFAEAQLPLALADALEAAGHALSSVAVDVGLDPLGDMARSGSSPAEPVTRAAKVAESLRARGFTGPLMRADGRPTHEAGGTEAQELAAVLATGVAYLRALEAEDLSLEAASKAISFVLTADTDLFLGLTKIRAMRRLWASVEAACGIGGMPIHLHVETAWRQLARRDPWTNIMRATIGCVSAILGGADSVTALPFTAALGLPDAMARRLARNTPLVLLQEAHLGRMVDPAAGAGGFEALTQALCEKAWVLFQEIEASGGMQAMLEAGRWQADVAKACASRRRAIVDCTLPIIGTSVFENPTDGAPPVLDVPRFVLTATAPRFAALPSRLDVDLLAEESQP